MSPIAQQAGSRRRRTATADDGAGSSLFLTHEAFVQMLRLEKRRTERSRSRFVLMLLESDSLLLKTPSNEALPKVLSVLSQSTRETDTKGWYEDEAALGVIFTEIGGAEGDSVAAKLSTKIINALAAVLSVDELDEISLSFHTFPDDDTDPDRGANSVLHHDLTKANVAKKASLSVKRMVDIAGSSLALIVGSPLLIAIAAAVKLTSKGPVLYKQQRIGQYGRKFTFLKFRSMQAGNNSAIHQEFVKRLIAGEIEPTEGDGKAVYKIKDDPRVTKVGKFLRKTSLDELPQFFNVLIGEMSLVGPRPPVPYEFECYDIWHKRRLLEVTPGITGLWQVSARSKTTFDDMVRLDLQYATTWSLWLDLKILWRTPLAVFKGEGAH